MSSFLAQTLKLAWKRTKRFLFGRLQDASTVSFRMLAQMWEKLAEPQTTREARPLGSNTGSQIALLKPYSVSYWIWNKGAALIANLSAIKW